MNNIDQLTISEARQIAQMFPQIEPKDATVFSKCPWNIGANYFIRTVTMHHTGKLVQVTQQELVLENAAWIADDGQLTQALEKCVFNEVEMFPVGRKVIVGRGSVIDAVEVTTIPTSQK